MIKAGHCAQCDLGLPHVFVSLVSRWEMLSGAINSNGEIRQHFCNDRCLLQWLLAKREPKTIYVVCECYYDDWKLQETFLTSDEAEKHAALLNEKNKKYPDSPHWHVYEAEFMGSLTPENVETS